MDFLTQLDTQLLIYIHAAFHHEPLHTFWRGISLLGDLGWFWIFTAVLLAINPKTRSVGLTALAALALGAFISNVILKNFFMRPRPFEALPQLLPALEYASGYSFPSGHTTAAFAAAFTYRRLLPKFIGLPALILAALIAFSRLYLGVHYPLDVLGGIATGWAGSTAAVKLACRIKNYRS